LQKKTIDSPALHLPLATVAILAAMFLCIPVGYGISISTAQIQPSGVISELDDVQLTVKISTGQSAAFLYRDTELNLRRNEIIVRMYPDEGLLTVPDSLTEQVKIGRLSPGDYRMLVLLEPASPVFGSPTFVVLEFTVVPILNAALNTEGIFVIWWEDPREEFFVEWTSDLVPGEWAQLPETPEFIGGRRWLWMPLVAERRFFRLARNG
jgi:hypothetical protein